MEAKRRAVVGGLLALLVTGLTYLTIPYLSGMPCGILLPIDGEYDNPGSVNQVVIYPSLDLALPKYHVIGAVNVQMHALKPTPQGEATLLNFASKLAAAKGANGILVKVFLHANEDQVSKQQVGYIFSGVAIRT